MFLAYNLLLPIIAVLLSPFILIALIIQPKFRAGFRQKIGFYSYKQNGRENVVFHAVSVGEVNAITSLVKKFREAKPDYNIILTTTTKTGQEVAYKNLEKYVDKITYFPFDFIFSVNMFFAVFKPKAVIIAETEIWPCFVSSAKNKNIDVYIVNGRISPHSYTGYKKFTMFFKPILSKYKAIYMQSDEDSKRIIDVGASSDIVKTMGNLKYDIEPNLTYDEVKKLWEDLSLGSNRLFIAASTHAGEDEIVIDTYLKAKYVHRDLKLLIAPRHPQRYEKVEAIFKQMNIPYGKRSENDTFADKEIIMLDTMGELAKMFSLAYVAFIGGSFASTGGHNPLEANIWGKPVISGPNVYNFKEVYKLLTEKKAAVVVNTSDDFLRELLNYLESPVSYSVASKAAVNIFITNKGAIDFVINNIA